MNWDALSDEELGLYISSINSNAGDYLVELYKLLETPACLKKCLEHGLNPNVRIISSTSINTTLARLAASNRFPDSLRLLVEHGAHIGSSSINMRTLMHLATAQGGNTQCVEYLAQKMKDMVDENGIKLIDAKNKHGETALISTPMHIDYIMVLLRNGADPNATNRWNDTLLDMLDNYKENDVIKINILIECAICALEHGAIPRDTYKTQFMIAACDIHKKLQVIPQLWEMLTSTYESHIQWLPRELMEDLISLLTQTFF